MQTVNGQDGRSRQRRHRGLRPTLQVLEPRLAPAIDLINVAGNAAGTPPGPYGVLEIGQDQFGGAGWSVALVGDVNGDGFEDYLIGAPTVLQTPGGLPFPTIGNGNSAAAYLIFGSGVAPNNGTFNWINLTPDERIAALANLGNSSQTNPLTGNAQARPINGLTFVTNTQTLFSAIGTSVAAAGDVNNDGLMDFLIGAPGAVAANGTSPGTGMAYLVFGSASLFSRTNKIVDLDNPSGAPDLFITRFVNSRPSGQSGWSVAGVGDFILDGTNLPDIAIGAPNASIGLAGQGLVYVVSGSAIPRTPFSTSVPIDLNTVGQAGGTAGVVFAGDLQGDAAGWSVAGAGDTADRSASLNSPRLSDLLIGAPDATNPNGPFNGPGSAYLIYADTPANLLTYTTTTNGVVNIDLGTVGGGQATQAPGAIFNGVNIGDLTGYAVSTAGDFNGDGVDDYLIGAPRWDAPSTTNDTGRATLIYGNPATPDPPGAIEGTLNLGNLPNTIGFAQIQGPSPFSFAGFSVTAVRDLNNDGLNEIAVGAPGTNNSSGQVALIAGNQGLFGTVPFNTLEAQQLGLIITQSNFPNQPSNALTLLGTSVSGRIPPPGTTTVNTVDQDQLGDLIVGAAGLTISNTTNNIGGGYALEGVFLQPFLPPPPPVGDITTTIGIGTTLGTPPYDIDKTTTPNLVIYVTANNAISPPFLPNSQIDTTRPITVTVGAVSQTFPPGSYTLAADPANPQNAIITITNGTAFMPVGNNLTLTFQAFTPTTGPNANRTVTGSTTVNVTGPPPTPAGAAAVTRTFARVLNIPPFGSRFLPNPAVVYKFNWQPLAPRIAYHQFIPARLREPIPRPDQKRPAGSSLKKYAGYGVTTLGQYVFTRGKYPPGLGVIDARHPPKTD